MKQILRIDIREKYMARGVPFNVAEARRLQWCAQRRRVLIWQGMSKKESARLFPDRGYKSSPNPVELWEQGGGADFPWDETMEQSLELIEALKARAEKWKTALDMASRAEKEYLARRLLEYRESQRGKALGCGLRSPLPSHPEMLNADHVSMLTGYSFDNDILDADSRRPIFAESDEFDMPPRRRFIRPSRLFKRSVFTSSFLVHHQPLPRWKQELQELGRQGGRPTPSLPEISFLNKSLG